MGLSLPSVKAIVKSPLMNISSLDKYLFEQANGEFYYRLSAKTPEVPSKHE